MNPEAYSTVYLRSLTISQEYFYKWQVLIY